MVILQNNAIFIADSHFNNTRTALLELLKNIDNNKIKTSQIFLMGDMFDFLSDEIVYFKTINQNLIALINKLAKNKEIIYLEGNHDFNIKNCFPNINVIKRENQPLYIKSNDKNIAIAHGDIFTPMGYNIYTNIIRNHYFLNFLNLIDINNWLSKKIEKKLKVKIICHKLKNLDKFIEKRISNYNTDLIIEGHFHQGIISDKYVNIPSLACDNRYIKYINGKFTYEI